jgi:hypothetical protein
MKMIKKHKLLVLVGAGASVDLGMPSSEKIHCLFIKWAQEEFPLADQKDSNLYSYIADQISRFYRGNPKTGLRKHTNFEELLYVILQLSTYKYRDNFSNPLLAFLSCREMPPVYHHGEKTDADGFLLYWLAGFLIDKLLEHFRLICKGVNRCDCYFKKHAHFWKKLREDYALGIFNLNYDNLILQALPGIGTGFSPENGVFNASSLMQAISWDFCYHIHGSIHFDMRKIDSMHRIYWQNDLRAQFSTNSVGRNPQSTREGYDFPTSVIIAGYEKLHQIRREPFRSFYNCLERAIFDADAILLVGSGQGDEHINSIFEEYFEKNPRKRVFIVTNSNGADDPIPFRCDAWVNNLCKNFHVSAHDFSSKGHSAPADISDLKRRNICEVNKDESVAVWYNGLLSLFDHYQVVLKYFDNCQTRNK